MKKEFDIKEFIFGLENKFPVDTWKVNGIDVWPIIRVKLQGRLNAGLGKGLSRNATGYVNYSNLSKPQKIAYFIRSFFKSWGLKKVDFVGISSFSHRSKFNDKYYSKFYDPLLDEVNKKGLIVEHNSKEFYQNSEIHNRGKVIFFEDYYYFYRVLFALKEKMNLFSALKKVELQEYELFLQDLNSLDGFVNLETEFHTEKLEPQINNILIYNKVYRKILKKVKPKFTFQVCHYNTHSVSMSIVSKEFQIPSIEIQHGGQPKIHMAYSCWGNLPKNGFNTLPKIFWHWDKESHENMNLWLSKNSFHSSIVLGNIWLDYIKSNSIKKQRKFILYSLQPFSFEQLFPLYLIDFIKNETQKKWWIRLHPTDKNRKEEFIHFFKENNIDTKIIFDDGSLESLPETLYQSFLHITFNSGAVIEASELGIKSIVLDSVNGPLYYEELIKKGEVELVEPFNFLNQVARLSRTSQETDRSAKLYKSCFQKIVEIS